MKNYIIKFKNNTIELSKKPEVYIFTHESCRTAEWVPFDINKFNQSQIWVNQKIYQGHDFNLHNHENIRFKLKNPNDINIFINWMSELAEVVLKKNYVKDIEYYEVENYINTIVIIFVNSCLVSLNDDYIEIRVDYIDGLMGSSHID